MTNDIMTMISTLGFPIVACVALGWFCKYMIDKNNENIDRMFQMYDKANEQNRTAIQDVTAAVDRLCDKLDEVR
jgi:hypothetical protein